MSNTQWTRATYMDHARAQADARLSARWTDADVKTALGLVHAREWKRLLNANRMLRYNALTIAQDTNGQIALSALDSGSGDTQKRLYRVLDVAQGTRVYQETQFTEMPTASVIAGTTGSTTLYAWYRIGDVIQLLPVEIGATMTVWVNHLPTPLDQLSADSVAVEFPRDYEPLLGYEAAAWLLVKGGAETDSAQALQQMAEQIRLDMLGDLARQSTAPLRIMYPDVRGDWGG